ncbi:MAG: STAS domain-containing protein [Desulfovibrio sp.]
MSGLCIEKRGELLLIRCSERLTLEVTGHLKSELEMRFVEGLFSVLALDLSPVYFLDSSGIGLLMTLRSRAARLGIVCWLLCPSSEVVRTLELVKLFDFFEYAESEKELGLLVD